MPATRSATWTEAEDQRLIELWRQHNSFAEMTWEFPGRTRNACIGRLTRLRKKLGEEMIPAGRDPRTMAPRKKGRKVAYAIKARAAIAITPPTPIRTPLVTGEARRLTLLELGPKDCRFIVTNHTTREHLYCAADASAFVDEYGNGCYCAFHRRVMRAPNQPRR